MRHYSVAGGCGLALNVLEWGNPDGRPILFIHGWSQSHLCWQKQYDDVDLAREFRLVALDLRGHGLSGAPAEQGAYTNSQWWADDIAAVIAAVDLERPVLVGWSYGGLVMTDYVRAYGEAAIAGINFVCAAVRLNAATIGPLIGPGFSEPFARAIAPDLATSIDAMRDFVERCFALKLSRTDYERTLCSNMTARADVRANLAARDVVGDAVLRGLRLPVLITQGRLDTMVLPAMAELIQGHCAQARLSWYADCAHGPFLEDPARFNRELADFVRAT